MSRHVGKLGIVRVDGPDMDALRWDCYVRDGQCCVVCKRWVRFEGDGWDVMHMAHIQNKQMYGDVLENVRTLCMDCHLIGDHNPKSVPKKQRA